MTDNSIKNMILIYLHDNQYRKDIHQDYSSITQKGLSEKLNCSLSSISYNINNLINEDLVEKTSFRLNGRITKIYSLTNSGKVHVDRLLITRKEKADIKILISKPIKDKIIRWCEEDKYKLSDNSHLILNKDPLLPQVLDFTFLIDFSKYDNNPYYIYLEHFLIFPYLTMFSETKLSGHHKTEAEKLSQERTLELFKEITQVSYNYGLSTNVHFNDNKIFGYALKLNLNVEKLIKKNLFWNCDVFQRCSDDISRCIDVFIARNKD
jgi:DNA-binding MarR family transcriptional regulator